MTPEQIVKTYQLDKRRWVKKAFHGVLHFHYLIWEIGFKDFGDYFGDSHQVILDFFEPKEYAQWYWCYEDMARIRDEFLEKMKRDPKWIGRLVREWHRRTKKFDKVIQKIERAGFSSLSNSDLFKCYREFYRAYLYEFSIAISIQDPFSMTSDEHLTPYFQNVIRARGKNKYFAKYFTLLMSPVTVSFVALEEYELAQLRLKIKSTRFLSTSEKRIIVHHAEKYHWLENNYAQAPRLGPEYFKKNFVR